MPQITVIGPTRIVVPYPQASAYATANVNPAGNENGLTYTARTAGAGGNAITVTYVDPGANDQSIAVTVSTNAISVSLATGPAGAITSTAAQVKAAIEASVAANALVSVAIMTADTGGLDDGSGVVTAMSATRLAGGAGYSYTYTNNAGTVTYNAPVPIDTASYRQVIVSHNGLAGAEEVDIYTVSGGTVMVATNSAGTAQKLTASINQLVLEAGPTYVFAKDQTAADVGVFVDLLSNR